MDSKQITQSIKTGRLQLKGWEQISFYEQALVLAGGGALLISYAIYCIYIADGSYRTGPLPVFLLPIGMTLMVPAVARFVNLWRSLKLTLISTSAPWPAAKELLLRLAARQGWTVLNNRKTLLRMRTHPDRWLDLRGEQISVFFNRQKIWVVSICDPDGLVALITQNRTNIQLIQRELSGSRRLAE